MASSSRGRWASPDRTIVWTEPPKPTSSTRRAPAPKKKATAAVVYYLSREDGQLDHPHFMEVPLSSPHRGLSLQDVLARLALLRGAAMAGAYSWSSKRGYRNGYVWHDLAADDLVHPANDKDGTEEYVLKGSKLLVPPRPRDASAGSSSSSSSSCLVQEQEPEGKTKTPMATGRAGRRKNWSSFDLGEYRVAAAVHPGADAATQTEDRRRRIPREPAATELGADEISPPPSSSSPDTLETLINHDARLAAASAAVAIAAPQREAAEAERVVGVIAGGRMRASAVLMQLISCGSIPAAAKPKHQRSRLPRGRSDLSSRVDASFSSGSGSSIAIGGMGMDREYFSGSLVETTTNNKSLDRDGAGAGSELKRSSSYNADRGSSKLELAEKEVDGVRARCIPRKLPSSNSKLAPAAGAQTQGTDGAQP
ncbi:protein UPSTREAM OF FLC isoform X2 [Brachypodium distachyon]|uniref:SOSEKI DIX-like domain-containing protein n=1 Tax=Brachypodium distachyon TaxID=15368 RepID=A0A0Q3GL37_BRADI|nr:protein UPSTREAM OF FLC isoform X2 [Brachypodium distachyon]KQK11799.1 hypothetical protein BRADI_2g62490v3 [Brachypodium distachyon]|eukprot:XP_010232885.1 protein UPSTREAM OF FLC isoform X2 [Brachypodium distachyon]